MDCFLLLWTRGDVRFLSQDCRCIQNRHHETSGSVADDLTHILQADDGREGTGRTEIHPPAHIRWGPEAG